MDRRLGGDLARVDIHDALDVGGVEAVDDGLPPGDLELRLAVGERGGRGGRVRQGPVLAEGVGGAALGVLPDVVVAELARRPQQRPEEREDLCSARCRRHF